MKDSSRFGFIRRKNLIPKILIISLLDINECKLDIDNCDVQATCTNNPGSYSCACNNGWTGDGLSCQGTNA